MSFRRSVFLVEAPHSHTRIPAAFVNAGVVVSGDEDQIALDAVDLPDGVYSALSLRKGLPRLHHEQRVQPARLAAEGIDLASLSWSPLTDADAALVKDVSGFADAQAGVGNPVSGVHFDIPRGTVVATDGARMLWRPISVSPPLSEAAAATIPLRRALSRMLAGGRSFLHHPLRVCAVHRRREARSGGHSAGAVSHLGFRRGEAVLFVRTIPVLYPAYHQSLPPRRATGVFQLPEQAAIERLFSQGNQFLFLTAEGQIGIPVRQSWPPTERDIRIPHLFAFSMIRKLEVRSLNTTGWSFGFELKHLLDAQQRGARDFYAIDEFMPVWADLPDGGQAIITPIGRYKNG